jgi:putative SOS response-associated peptidase YedK
MCGRFAQTTPPDEIVALFKLVMGLELVPRFNIAPTTEILAIRGHADGRRAHRLRWGLVPPWAKDLKRAAQMINARSEGIFERASFKDPILHRRCVVPASGFYEWEKTATGKNPFLIQSTTEAPLMLAGIWSPWRGPDGANIHTASILTVSANADMAALHNRMPVLLDGESMARWLDPKRTDKNEIIPLLRPSPSGSLQLRPVSPFVNNVRNEGPRCWTKAITQCALF